MKELVLVKQTEFEGAELDCYVDPTQQDKGNFWATREQIGRLLEYENPRKAIKDIHERHRERLDKFSTVVKLPYPVRGAQNDTPLTNQQDTTIYNFKGLLDTPISRKLMQLWIGYGRLPTKLGAQELTLSRKRER